MLKIAKSHEAVTASSLHNVLLSADLGEWKTFEQEVSTFHAQVVLQDAFKSSEDIQHDVDLAATESISPHYAGLEHNEDR